MRIPPFHQRSLFAASAICFSLGTISSVLVAWACELADLGQSHLEVLRCDVAGAANVFAMRRTRLGIVQHDVVAFTAEGWKKERTRVGGFGPSYTPPSAARINLWNKSEFQLSRFAAAFRWEQGTGLPFVCLWKWCDGDWHGSSSMLKDQGALELPQWLGFRPGTTLPYLPIWPGLIANTVFWGGAWWCALFVPAMVRKRRRIKRGQCPACGYDLSANPAGTPCPECGGSNT